MTPNDIRKTWQQRTVAKNKQESILGLYLFYGFMTAYAGMTKHKTLI